MTRLNIKILSFIGSLMISAPLFAMDSLDDAALAEESGQAGADISVKFTINHDASANFVCADLVYCRLAMSLNNRYHDGSQDTYDVNGNRIPSPTGRKQWLVFKGIQGTINIQELKFDGEDVTYGAGIVKGTLKFGFTANKPIQIRNFGFNSLSLETDTVANEGVGNTPGYLSAFTGNNGTSKQSVTGRYNYTTSVTEGSTTYTTTAFDHGREVGFLGLNVNTNLSLTGSIKMFSCFGGVGGHPRC